MDNELFYIRTKDGTEIAIFDLGLVGNNISYSYNAVEENIDVSSYDVEINEILSSLITKEILNNSGCPFVD